ncbi:hypothetical protein PM082_004337 [Marasmius tenuissimus]|nr:hypothetical protein PM082_004337 [Marasmius tenuissimus]
MAVQICRSRSVFLILEKIDAAVKRAYTPQTFGEIDFQRAYLIYKIGGQCVANIAKKALGIPCINATKKHLNHTLLLCSAGFPTLDEMIHNLWIALAPPESLMEGMRQIIVGMGLCVDKMKIREALWWDLLTNLFIGLCWEHGSICDLEF